MQSSRHENMSLDIPTKPYYGAASHQHHRDTTTAEARAAAPAAHRVVTEAGTAVQEQLSQGELPRSSTSEATAGRDCCHDHRHLGAIRGNYEYCCTVGTSTPAKRVLYVLLLLNTAQQAERLLVRAHFFLFRFECVAAGQMCSTTIVGNTGYTLALA